MSLVLLFMAVGYANNIIYFFVFALISVALSSMAITNKNVERTRIVHVAETGFFADEVNQVPVSIENVTSRASFLLELSFQKKEQRQKIDELAPGQYITVPLAWSPSRRGLQSVGKIILYSRFPFGLLRAWRTYEMSQKILVYPSRQGRRAFPLSAMDQRSEGSLGLFRDHREYQTTDSPRRIDWRASAKHQDLFVKNYEASEKAGLHLDWSAVDFLPAFEEKISQLCLWICLAEQEGRAYSLSLGSFHSGIHSGPEHRHRCLAELALVKQEDLR